MNGSLYVYRLIEDIIIDTGMKFPSGISAEDAVKFNSNVQVIFDMRDYIKIKKQEMNIGIEYSDLE